MVWWCFNSGGDGGLWTNWLSFGGRWLLAVVGCVGLGGRFHRFWVWRGGCGSVGFLVGHGCGLWVLVGHMVVGFGCDAAVELWWRL